jgi:hypothetical protein
MCDKSDGLGVVDGELVVVVVVVTVTGPDDLIPES